MERVDIAQAVTAAVDSQPITDLHTHCYTPKFGASPTPGGLLLWGIDELVTYHYLIAEVYRIVPSSHLPYADYWKMSKQQQADHIWQHLFVERTPISEACRGVLTTITALGLDPNEKSLQAYRKWFSAQKPSQYIDTVMELANVDSITMTNPVFDDHERSIWETQPAVGDDPRFEAVLRIDPLLRNWPSAMDKLKQWGYDVRPDFSGNTVDEVRRFLCEWVDRMKAIYIAMSLPPDFRYPAPSGEGEAANRFIRDILMPVCADRGLPWAMMIGSRLQVNPDLRDAGDMSGKADIESIANLCNQFPNNKFLVTMLDLENQHELCVTARKFGNLLVFGCWWFLNNPTLVEHITRMRIELLGTTFVPQHSDARILDQMIYKWKHTRGILQKVLVDKYTDIAETGFEIASKQICNDVSLLMRNNFRNFLSR